jgi:hypothetical protein
MRHALIFVVLAGWAGSARGQTSPPSTYIELDGSGMPVLSWQPVPGASCYEIQGGFPPPALPRFLGRTTDESVTLQHFVDPDPSSGNQTESFRVVALDECSPYSLAPNGLVAWYPFDGNGQDVGGLGLHLTAHGGQFVPGRMGQALRLNGSSEWYDRVHSSHFVPGNGPFSVSVWVRGVGGQSPEGMAVSWYRCGANPGCSNGDGAQWDLSCPEPGQGTWAMRDNNNATQSLVSASLSDYRWHLLTGTRDPEGICHLYVDGNRVASAAQPVGNASAGTVQVPLSVGRVFVTGWGSPGSYYDGELDDLRIWNRALGLDEVRALYTQGGWPFEP